jgi:transcriptional regulator with XRE-family HTH domain
MSIHGFGARVREARERAGVSQRQLAKRLACLPSHLSHIESGARLPSVERLRAMCVELRCSADKILGLDGAL